MSGLAGLLACWLASCGWPGLLWKACVLAAMESVRVGWLAWLAGWLGLLAWVAGWRVSRQLAGGE